MKEKIFKTFNDLIFETAHQFYVWRYLQNSEFNSGINARGHYWITAVASMQKGFLLNLANIFDKDERVFSVYTYLSNLKDQTEAETLIKEINDKCGKTIKTLIIWRNNF